MVKLSKHQRFITDKFNKKKIYAIQEAIILLKNLASAKFIESIDIAVNLGIDARKTDQVVRGAIVLPHGTGRSTRVAVFAQGTNVKDAMDAGADIVGMDDLVELISKGEMPFDLVIASPDVMPLVSKLGHILGPRGLMPNPKLGTITTNLSEAVRNAKSGQIRYRNDKNGIIHTTIGKINFSYNDLKENLEALIIALIKAKPINSKGIYLKKISLTTTMGIGLVIDQSSLNLLSASA
ncbi:MAG: 50S ribosomal protein L1 [Candidatus Dasytiphilus stammeri]